MGRATSVETPGVHLRTRTKQLGAKEKARRKKCDVRLSIVRSNRVKKEKLDVRKLLRNGPSPRKKVVRTGRWPFVHRKVEVEATDGGNESASFSLFMEGDLEVEGNLSTMATPFGRKACGWAGWGRKQQKAPR